MAAANHYPPDLEVRRQMLTRARDEFRAKGYEAELNLAALTVQEDEENADTIATQRNSLENTRDNNYAAAREMGDMLKALPKPSPNPATRKKA